MNEYRLTGDGRLLADGKQIAIMHDGDIAWDSDAKRRKHAIAVAELMGSGGIPADTTAVTSTASTEAQKVAEEEEDVFAAPLPDTAVSLTDDEDMMAEPEDLPIPRRDAVMGEYTAEWLRWDARYLDRMHFRAKWDPFAKGNPQVYKSLLKAAGFEN